MATIKRIKVLCLIFTPPPPPRRFRFLASQGKNQKGFSLVGALTASVIGLMVTYGMTHTLVQTKLNTLAIEKRDRRKSLYRFVDNVLSDSQSCLYTLQGQPLSLPSTAPERSFEITALKDSNNGKLMDFSKTNGILDDAATKEKLKNLGIDKFDKLEFRYKTALPRTGQVVLTSKTVVKGLHEKSNRELIWEISGLKVETKTDSDNNTSEQVTLCQDSVPLKVLCGANVTGTGHLNGGGFVQSTATVDSGAYVSDKAVVCGNAKVKGTAKVFGNAQVTGNAEIKGSALVYDNAKVSGNAVISGNARVFDSAKVIGDAKIKENAKISGMAVVKGDAEVKGSAEVYDNSKVFEKAVVKGSAKIYGIAQILGNSEIYGNAQVYGNAKIYSRNNSTFKVKIYGDAKVFDSAKISSSTASTSGPEIYGNAIVRSQAWITDDAKVYDYGKVLNGTVAGKGQVYGNSKNHSGGVNNNGRLYGNAEVHRNAWVTGTGRLHGDIILVGASVDDCNCSYTKQAGERVVRLYRDCKPNTNNPCVNHLSIERE